MKQVHFHVETRVHVLASDIFQYLRRRTDVHLQELVADRTVVAKRDRSSPSRSIWHTTCSSNSSEPHRCNGGDDMCAFCDPNDPSWTLDAILFEDVDASDSELLSVHQGEGLTSSLGTLAKHLSGLVATDTSTPLATLLLVFVRAVT